MIEGAPVYLYRGRNDTQHSQPFARGDEWTRERGMIQVLIKEAEVYDLLRG